MDTPGRVNVPADERLRPSILHGVFFISGLAAILYQFIWQRVLFTLYGCNIEAITIVVTAFMLGLGLGSLAGGSLSRRSGLRLPAVFAALELGIGIYGLISLPLFRFVGAFTAGASDLATAVLSFTLVFVPTLLMGATLPVLLMDAVRRSGNVGGALGNLYFTNTLGSAMGAFVSGLWIFGSLGQSGAVRLAAFLNLLVAAVVLGARRLGRRAS